MSASKHVFLHVGAGKTGSSYLQTLFARHQAELLAQGVLYPRGPLFQKAIEGGITSGNAGNILKFLLPKSRAPQFSEEVFFDSIGRVLNADGYHSVLWSDERLQWVVPEKLQALAAFFAERDARVTVIMLLRDLVDHAFSHWGQAIKGQSLVVDWPGWCKTYKSPLWRFAKTYLDVFGRGNCVFWNYQDVKSDLAEVFFKILNVSVPAVRGPQMVNRSLSERELACMLHMNRLMAEYGLAGPVRMRLSRELSESFVQESDQVPARPVLSEAQFAQFKENNRSLLDALNTQLGEFRQLRMWSGPEIGDFRLPEVSAEDKAILRCLVTLLGTDRQPAERR